MLHPIPLYLLVFVFGTLIGSFLNVVIYRTPQLILASWHDEDDGDEEELEIPAPFFARLVFALQYIGLDIFYSLTYLFKDFWQEAALVLKGISFPGSHCGHCKQEIAWYHNLPILSWFILGGKCKNCQQSYSFRYPALEFSTACLMIYTFWLYGVSIDFIYWGLLVASLWAIFWIDFDTKYVFNVMTYPSILLGILYNGTKVSLIWSLTGGLLAWFIFELIMFMSLWLLKKEGMGGGDVKLAIIIGIWLGPTLLLVALALAFLLGTLAGIPLLIRNKKSEPFPFGPFLVLGMLLSMAVGDHLWTWYIGKSF